MNCDIYRSSTKVTGFILLALDQAAFGTVGSFQWNSGSGQVDKDAFSPVSNMKAGHADRTKSRSWFGWEGCFLAEEAIHCH